MGDQAPAVNQQLTPLIQAAEQTPQDKTSLNLIRLLLSDYPAVQTWLNQNYSPGVDRTVTTRGAQPYSPTKGGFEHLAGNPAPVTTAQYICPQCNTTYFRRGSTIPTCDRHQPAVTCIAMENTP